MALTLRISRVIPHVLTNPLETPVETLSKPSQMLHLMRAVEGERLD